MKESGLTDKNKKWRGTYSPVLPADLLAVPCWNPFLDSQSFCHRESEWTVCLTTLLNGEKEEGKYWSDVLSMYLVCEEKPAALFPWGNSAQKTIQASPFKVQNWFNYIKPSVELQERHLSYSLKLRVFLFAIVSQCRVYRCCGGSALRTHSCFGACLLKCPRETAVVFVVVRILSGAHHTDSAPSSGPCAPSSLGMDGTASSVCILPVVQKVACAFQHRVLGSGIKFSASFKEEEKKKV